MQSDDQLSKPVGPGDVFVTTRWSIVAAAGRTSSPDSRRALASLCETYWYPLYAYVRRRVPDVDDSRDLRQAFFTELLEKHYVGSADPNRGRFRAFLITAFKHFLSKHWEKERAQIRGGGKSPISLDFDSAEFSFRSSPSEGITPEQLFDQQWAIALLRQTMQSLEEDFERAGKASLFSELKGFIVGDHDGMTYAQVAEKLNMSEAAAKKAASRIRLKFRQRLREEIAQTVTSSDEIEDEIRSLFTTLAT